MANKLDIDVGVNGANKAAKELNKVSKATNKIGGSSRDATFLVNNFAEGIGDMQYGLRNVANNAEIMLGSFQRITQREGSVSGAFKSIAGALSGPSGVIAAAILLINFAPQIVDFFSNAFSNPASKAKDDIAKVTEELDKLAIAAGIKKPVSARATLTERLAKEIKDIESSIATELKKGEEIEGFVDYQAVKALRAQLKNLKVLKQQYDLKFAEQDLEKSSAELKKQQNKLFKVEHDLIELTALGMAARGESEEDILEYRLKELKALTKEEVGQHNLLSLRKEQLKIEAQLYAIRNAPAKSTKGGTTSTPVSNAFGGGVDSNTGSLFNPDFLNSSDFEQWRKEQVVQAEDAGKEIGQSLGDGVQNGLNSAFVSLGAALGQTLAGDGNFGDKFLAILGNFMVAFGGAMIALGVAKLKLDSLLAVPGAAPGIIAGGVALAAVGSALATSKAATASGYGGGGGSGFNLGTATGTGISPTLTQSSQTNQFTLGEVRLRGQDLIATLQSGNRIRRNKT